jgi:hypothetical protein
MFVWCDDVRVGVSVWHRFVVSEFNSVIVTVHWGDEGSNK